MSANNCDDSERSAWATEAPFCAGLGWPAPLLGLNAACVTFDGFRTDPVLDHAEGLDFDPVDGSLWCGGESGQIYRIDLYAQVIAEKHRNPGGFTLGVRFGPDRTLYWLDAVRRQVWRLAVGSGTAPQMVIDGNAGGHEISYPNALDFGPDGAAYFTDSSDGPNGLGAPGVYRIAPDGSVCLWSRGPFRFANGIAVAPDGSALYVAESAGNAITRVPIRSSGQAGQPECLWHLGTAVPDGVAFGPDGRLYGTCYYPSVIVRLDDDGAVTPVYEDPIGHILSNPTNLVFRGTDAFVANLGRWHIARIDMSSVLG